MHITFTTGLLGVIDDMFIQTELSSTGDYSVINIMSQLRIGRSDFNVNYDHVDGVLKCLNNELADSLKQTIRPCGGIDS